MDDETSDIPLDNFGAETEVATSPVAEEAHASEQTTQPTEETGSEDKEQPKTEIAEPTSEVNPKPEEQKSGRPEKQERLQNRFGELTGRLKERDSEIEQLQSEIARIQAMSGVQPLQPDAEGQYSMEAVQKNQLEMAEAIASSKVQALEQRLERNEIANTIDSQGSQIESKWREELDRNPIHSDNIRAEVEERIALANGNLQALKQISPLKIAERYFKAIESERRLASTSSAQNLKNLQAEQAVTPNAPSAPAEDDEAALEARLADIKF